MNRALDFRSPLRERVFSNEQAQSIAQAINNFNHERDLNLQPETNTEDQNLQPETNTEGIKTPNNKENTLSRPASAQKTPRQGRSRNNTPSRPPSKRNQNKRKAQRASSEGAPLQKNKLRKRDRTISYDESVNNDDQVQNEDSLISPQNNQCISSTILFQMGRLELSSCTEQLQPPLTATYRN